jgi:hypothetical protein
VSWRSCLTPLFLFQSESVYLVGPRIAKQKRRIGRVKTQPTLGVPPHISKFLQIDNPLLVAAGDGDPEDATIIGCAQEVDKPPIL